MNRLEFVIVKALHKNRGKKSESTLARQKQEGRQMARQLWDGGFRITELKQLRGKSVGLLTDVWKGNKANPCTGKVRQLSKGVQEVRMTTLRLICKLGGKPGLVPKSNKKAGLVPRERTPSVNIAWKLTPEALAKVPDSNARLVLRLQEQFGLRKKEGCLLDARSNDKGEYLLLDRGTKGGKVRTVAIRTIAQRRLLGEVKAANNLAPKGTLVAGASLKGCFDDYKTGMRIAGLTHGHGLRHQYAQERHHQLVKHLDPKGKGWLSPKMGGLYVEQLNEDDRKIDNDARRILAAELGHRRVEVVATYIGKDKPRDAQNEGC